MAEFKKDLSELEKVFEEYENIPENLISVLQKAQEIYGYLPKEVIYRVAEKLGITPAKVMGVATFYSQFRLEPMGKYRVMLCAGTACHVNGSEKVAEAVTEYLGIESGKTTKDGLFTLEKVACLGCCSLAPVMMINGEAYGNLTPEKAVSIIKNLREKEGAL
ncbi:MAG: NADH-quinone oxidoreductase subunit NuoE [Oscillospiraceae bacterium]|nr:NADH-quinone oxidoreductase subunit NuoE [Oscillospiraceae bacterium]